MKMFSYRNDIVLDPFGGLGTTALVAKKNGRRYISIDKSEEYCRKTNERMSQMELL
jgi:DNA modification methylase